ncbi:MAG TPA: glycosyltransferase family 4 protein [Gaiellaceae bacterium]
MVPVRDRAAQGLTRVTLLTEIPAPYRIPLFNALADRVSLRVVFLRERHPDRPYKLHRDELKFDWRVIRGLAVTLRSRWFVLNVSVGGRLRHADVVILGGWNQPAYWEALAWCHIRGIPTIVWSESTGRDNRSGRHELFKRVLLPGVDAFIVPGAAAREYLLSLGVTADRITVAPNAVDPGIFGAAKRTRENGICRLVAVARLSPEKGLDVLLEAIDGLPVELVIAGTGPEESRLRRLAGPNVTFLGNVERDALPGLYADADIAVAPSRSDPWGMVLNEAALAGLPLVSTTAPGAAQELIEEGVNGFRVAPDDPGALRDAILRLEQDEPFRRAAGERSKEIAARFTPAAWADAVAAAVAERIPA